VNARCDLGSRRTNRFGWDEAGFCSAGEPLHGQAAQPTRPRTVPGYGDVQRAAYSRATVTLWANNGAYVATSRKGEYFRGEVGLDDRTGAV